MRVAIMASGTGTNARALIEKSISLRKGIQICALISDKKNSGIFSLGEEFQIPSFYIPIEKSNDPDKKEEVRRTQEMEILCLMDELQVDWVFLAGYMKILGEQFIQSFYDTRLKQTKLINIHPSLLPQYKGVRALQRAFEDRVDYSGITVHHVVPEVDSGMIIAQERFPRLAQDSLEQFIQRAQKVEHRLYPQVLEKIYTDYYGKGNQNDCHL